MSNILITGGAGMLGQALARKLARENYVIAIDNFSRDPFDSYSRMTALDEAEAYFAAFDIDHSATAISELTDYMVKKKIDVVINAAADVGGVHYNRDNGASIFSRNALLQSIPILAAQRAGVSEYIGISSVCVYEPTIGLPGDLESYNFVHREDMPLGELSIDNGGYALAKRAGEVLAMSADIEYVSVVRPTNMFGRFDYYDAKSHVIPALIKQALREKEIIVRGHPDIERDFLYVDDAAMMIEALLKVPPLMRDREVYNLPATPGGRITLGKLAETINSYTEQEDKRIDFIYEELELTEVSRRVDGQKIINITSKYFDVSELSSFYIALGRTVHDASEEIR